MARFSMCTNTDPKYNAAIVISAFRVKPAFFAGLLIVTLAPRLYLLHKSRAAPIDFDEAVVGLMARHILEGDFPIFYYGQYYMGTLEAFLAALVFTIFGAGPFVLKLAPLIPFCGFLIAHYFLAIKIAGRRVATMATLLLAVSPTFLTIWSMKARGGYTILLLLGACALLIANRMLETGYSRRDTALLGLVLGLAWWTHFLSIVYIAPIIILLLLRNERECFSSAGLFFAGSFLLGSLPFWIFNIQHPLASLGIGGARQTSYLTDFANIFATGLPILLGARPNWGTSGTDFVPFVGLIVVALFFVSLIRAPKLLLTFTGLFPFLLSAAGFAWFVQEPRYLIPLYSTIYIVILNAFRVKFALFAGLLALNIYGSTQIKNDTTPLEPLIKTLHHHNIKGAYADYSIAYRLTFESNEQIICTPPGGPTMRYEPYLNYLKSLPAPAYITPGTDIHPPEDYIAIPVGSRTIHIPPAE